MLPISDLHSIRDSLIDFLETESIRDSAERSHGKVDRFNRLKLEECLGICPA